VRAAYAGSVFVLSLCHANSTVQGWLEYFYLRSTMLQSTISFRVWDDSFTVSEDEDNNVDINQLAETCGLLATTKEVVTEDGYVLNLQRLEVARTSKSADSQPSSSKTSVRPPVLLVHGLMQDCESFLCCGRHNSLASVLAHDGYDVWLGNNRGSRYSMSHNQLSSNSSQYWNFAIDHLANYDLPAMVKGIVDTVNRERGSSSDDQGKPRDRVIVIGFSQGAAQTILGISTSSYLQQHVDLFVALAPPIKLKGFNSTYLASLVTTYPALVSTMFGRKAMFASVLGIKNVLTNAMFGKLVTRAMNFLFGWSCTNIAMKRRPALFQHIFSPSSVLCVLHWFQIMESNALANYRYSDADKGAYHVRRGMAKPLSNFAEMRRLWGWGKVAWALVTTVLAISWGGVIWKFVIAGVSWCTRQVIWGSVDTKVGKVKQSAGSFGSQLWSSVTAPFTYLFGSSDRGNEDNDDASTNNLDAVEELDISFDDVHPILPSEKPASRPDTPYDINNVSCPVAIFAGDADGLIDVTDIHAHMPNCVYHHVEPSYEHLDIIWADTAPRKIFPKIRAVMHAYEQNANKSLQRKQDTMTQAE
jgi:pimeloyl-ACP methyl ester carboxylesterase